MRPLALLTLSGCFPDDWNGLPYTGWHGSAGSSGDTGAGPVGGSPLAGAWVSAGDDLAPLLAGAPFLYARVDAAFDPSGSYLVTVTNTDGVSADVSGTWETEESTDPATIALHQADPYVAEATGIWEVDGGVLTYEVVQTVPDYGFTPPTPSSGFGSTAGPGIEPGVNVQTYRRP